MSSQTRVVPVDLVSPLMLALGLAFAGSAQAQESVPWYIGVSQAFTHDTNVFRAPDGFERGDTYSSTGVLGGLDLHPGRQHIYLDASAAANRFNDLKELNNTSYSLSTGLNWQTVEHLSGSISAIGHRNLGQVTIPGTTQAKNIETLQQELANVRYGFASHMGIEAGVVHRKLDYTFTTEQNLSENSGHVGLRWGTPGSVLTFGVAGRVTNGDAPLFRTWLDPHVPQLGLGPVTPDSYKRKDIDFTATWVPSDLSTVDARISLTREDHSAATRPDVSGVTGAVVWDYRPTGRLKVKTSFSRDTGSQTVFSSSVQTLFQPVIEANTSRVNNVLAVEAAYELTGKIGLTGSLAYNSASLIDVIGGTGSGSSAKYALGANYQPTRAIAVNCGYTRVTQTNYHDGIASCSAQFVLR